MENQFNMLARAATCVNIVETGTVFFADARNANKMSRFRTKIETNKIFFDFTPGCPGVNIDHPRIFSTIRSYSVNRIVENFPARPHCSSGTYSPSGSRIRTMRLKARYKRKRRKRRAISPPVIVVVAITRHIGVPIKLHHLSGISISANVVR